MVFKGILKAGSQAEDALPDDTIFIATENVRVNIADAVKFLKEKLATSKASFNAFHHMPWYLVLGLANSGKSRLIERSQLSFLETDRFVQLTPSRMNTSGNINWWFTQRAALLDVPGNFMEQPLQPTASRAAWLELLKQLKRVRPKNPIQGVILTIDIQTLSQPIIETAKLLRTRLQEMAHRLNQSFPVYVVCTQADKMLGFNEYFDDLGQTERDQHLGITFPLHFNQKNSPTQIFPETFDKLVQNLHQRALWRIHHERDQNKRKLIQHFPNELNTLKENLQRLIYDLSTSSYQMAVRGIYFTSSSGEEEKTVDTINTTIEKTFSLLPTRHSHLDAPLPSAREKTFFIKQLFSDRIFAESAIAIEALRAPTRRRDQILRFAGMGFACAALLSITFFWTHQYQHQKTALNHTSNALSVYRLLSLAYNPHPVDLTTLTPSLDALRVAHNNASDANLPWLLRFQLHRQESISTVTDNLYQKSLQTKLIPAIRHTLSWQLQSQNITDSTQLYSLFQAYLMLGDPSHADKQFLTLWFSRDWQNPAVRNPEFMGHLDAALQGNLLLSPPNAGLVTQIRANLNALPYGLLADAILRTKLSPTPVQPVPFTQQRVFGFSPQGVPEIFTISNLNNVDSQINNALSEAIQGNWVLGKKITPNLGVQDINTLKQDLMQNYAQDYVSAWQSWLNAINLNSFTSPASLEFALQELTSPHSPLKQILTTVAKNTNLTGLRTNDPAFAATLQNNLAAHFTGFYAFANPAKLSALLSPLKTLQTELHQQKSTAKTLTTLLENAKTAPAPLNSWLYSIAFSTRNFGLQGWELQNYPTCHGLLDNRYPFNKNATTAVSLTSFSYYLAPSGALSSTFANVLSPFVDTSHAQWQWKYVNSAFAQSNASALSQFERANLLRQFYFNSKSQLSVPFMLTSVSHGANVKNTQFLVNGKPAEKVQLNWPVDTKNLSIVITDKAGNTHTLKEQGDWALFKLLDKSEMTPHADNQRFDLSFTINGHKANYVLTAQPLNPFIPGIINSFQCPKFDVR